MEKKQLAKNKIRSEVADLKRKLSKEEFNYRSEEVLSTLEITGVFQQAKTIFIYNSLRDEVQTAAFMEKWKDEKEFYLPAVVDHHLVFRKYTPDTNFTQSSLGILEPKGEDFTDFKRVDLIIVPGTAFDRKMNRLGKGKGYYDKFLTSLSAPKVGVCFDFQLFDSIPFDEHDVKMDYLVSENELIWQ